MGFMVDSGTGARFLRVLKFPMPIFIFSSVLYSLNILSLCYVVLIVTVSLNNILKGKDDM
jgi:hypothetical protein